MQRTLHCYIYGRDDAWEAICVDLDIAVQGGSKAEVAETLLSAIHSYLDRVSELPAEEQRAFLYRRSPLHVRAKLAIWALLTSLTSGDGGAAGYSKFTPEVAAPA